MLTRAMCSTAELYPDSMGKGVCAQVAGPGIQGGGRRRGPGGARGTSWGSSAKSRSWKCSLRPASWDSMMPGTRGLPWERQFEGRLLPFQSGIPTHVSGEAAEDGPSARGDPGWSSRLRLQPGPVPAIVASEPADARSRSLSLSVAPPPSVTLPFK